MIDKNTLKEQISLESFYSGFFPEHKLTSNGEWLVICPFHDDHNPSMNVNIKTGLFFCHSCGAKGDYLEFYQKKTGRSFSDSVNEIGQQVGVQPAQPIKPKIVKTYDYLDMNGNLVSQTVRYEPKKFSQRTKVNGQWVWSLKSVRPVLYNLQDVINADVVLLMEGEKDCDTAKELGYVATTCPMGAGSWRADYSQCLYGKEVILMPDNDQVGIKHMLSVGKLLKDKSTVKWFEFPAKNQKGFDFTDLANSYDNEFEAMKNIDILLRSARAFDETKIIIPIPDSKESDQIKAWISDSPGEFTVKDLDYDLGFQNSEQRVQRTKILEKFVAENVLSREGKRRGVYRPYHKELEVMDYMEAKTGFLPIWMPMSIHKMVGIMPGNIIVLAGDANAGKTAMMLNIIKNNMTRFNVHYFNSEMGGNELKTRMEKFDDIHIDQWKYNAYSRDCDFADVVFTGEKSLNIIDFLEIHDDFYLVGEKIKQIHSALKGGVGIIAIQKNKGSDLAVGGNRTMEKARLVVNVESGRFKITKAKNFIDPTVNPNGMMCDWKLVNGCRFVMNGAGWYKN